MSEKELEQLVLEILKMLIEADRQFWPVNLLSLLRPHLCAAEEERMARDPH